MPVLSEKLKLSDERRNGDPFTAIQLARIQNALESPPISDILTF